MFVIIFTTARHLSLSSAGSTQSTLSLHDLFFKTDFYIWFSHLYLHLPSDLQNKTLYASFFSPTLS